MLQPHPATYITTDSVLAYLSKTSSLFLHPKRHTNETSPMSSPDRLDPWSPVRPYPEQSIRGKEDYFWYLFLYHPYSLLGNQRLRYLPLPYLSLVPTHHRKSPLSPAWIRRFPFPRRRWIHHPTRNQSHIRSGRGQYHLPFPAADRHEVSLPRYFSKVRQVLPV